MISGDKTLRALPILSPIQSYQEAHAKMYSLNFNYITGTVKIYCVCETTGRFNRLLPPAALAREVDHKSKRQFLVNPFLLHQIVHQLVHQITHQLIHSFHTLSQANFVSRNQT